MANTKISLMESSAQNLSGNGLDAAGKHFEVCETKK